MAMNGSEHGNLTSHLAVCVAAGMLLAALFALHASSGYVQAYGTWSDPVEISSEWQICITSESSSVYSYWDTMTVSLDGGDTWSDERVHSGMIDVSDGVLYRVNMSDEESSAGTVLFSSSDDDGITWSETVEVFPIEAWNDGAFGIYVIQDVLFVYSYDWAGWSHGSIIVSKSSDFGETWSAPDTIDPNVHVEDPIPADIVYSEGNLYLVYSTYETTPTYRNDVVIAESTDMGESWGDRRVVSNGMLPLIKADSGSLYVTYWGYDGGLEHPILEFIRSENGDTWSLPAEVGVVEDFTDSSCLHSLAVSYGEVFVAYGDYDSSTEEYTVRINYSADSGDTWVDMGDVTGTNSNTIIPALSIDGTRLHFTWIDVESGSGDGATYYRSLSLVEEPIPEFSSPVALICAMMAIVVAVTGLRHREKRP